MRNIKKVVSLVIVLTMLLSVFGTGVQANEVLTVKYWNADSTKIVLDFSNEVDSEALKAQIILSKDGVRLSGSEFSVVKKVKSTTATNTLGVDSNFTYFIIPTDGISFDSSYSVTVPAGFVSKDASVSLQEKFEKTFMVEKIWMETFENYTEANPSPWIPWSNGSSKQISYVEDASGDTELLFTMTDNDKDGIIPNPTLSTGTFADTGKPVATYFDSNDAKGKLTDYTLEAKVKIASSDDLTLSNPHSVVMSMQAYQNESNLRTYYNRLATAPLISAGYGVVGSTPRVSVFINNPDESKNTQHNGEKTVLSLTDNLQYGVELSENPVVFANNETKTISMSVKGENIRFSAGDNLFVSYNYDVDNFGLDNYRMPSLTFNVDSDNTYNYYIDDIVATKVKEVNISSVAVKYFNADSSKIVVDLDTALDTNILKSAISIKKDGNAVTNFTVTQKTRSTNTAGTLTVDNNTTYYIAPAEGITTDSSVYTFTIDKNIAGSNKMYVLPEEFSKTFKVEKIWKEDFENYSEENSLPWVMWKSGSTRTPALTTTNGDTELTVTANNDGIMPSPTLKTGTFADTGKSVNAYFSDSSVKAKLKNYTLEAKIKINFSTCTWISHGQGAGLSMQQYIDTSDFNNYYNKFTSTPMIAGGFWGYTYEDGVQSFVVANNPKDGTINAKSNGALKNTFVESTGALTDTPKKNVFDRDGREQSISLSVLDGNIKVAGGSSDGFVSYNYDTAQVAISDYSFPVVFLKGCSGGHTMDYSIDDIIATRMKEVVVGRYTMTPADGATEVSASDTVTLTFEADVDPATAINDNIKVYKNGEAVSNYTVSVSTSNPKELIVKFNRIFDYRATYIIEPGDIKMLGDTTNYAFYPSSFTVAAPPVELSDFSVSEEVDMSSLAVGTYTVTATIDNNNGALTENVIMSICLYDSNKKLINVAIKGLSVPRGEDETLTATWNITEAGAYTANCFVWSNIDTMGTIFNESIE